LEFIRDSHSLLLPNRRPVSDEDYTGIAQLWRDDLSAVQTELNIGTDKEITAARCFPQGNIVLVGDRLGRAHLVDRVSGAIVDSTNRYHYRKDDRLLDIAIAPDGNAVAITHVDGTIQYYAVQTNRGVVSFSDQPRIFQAHQWGATAVRFISANEFVTCGLDGLVKVWILSDQHAYQLGASHVRNVSLSPDGESLLYTDKWGCLLMDCSSGKILRNIDDKDAEHTRSAWSPAGDRFALFVPSGGKRRVRIFDREGDEVCAIYHRGFAEAIAFSPTERLVAVIGSGELRLNDLETGKGIAKRTLSAQGNAVAISHDGKLLAYGGDFDQIYLCDLPGLLPVRELTPGTHTKSIAFSPDNATLATGDTEGFVRLWDVATGQLRAEILKHEFEVGDVAFSPDGRTLLTCDGALRIWSVDRGRYYGAFFNSAYHMSLSANGRRLAVGVRTGTADGTDVFLWRIRFPE
jgi:WD40 repeat protein